MINQGLYFWEIHGKKYYPMADQERLRQMADLDNRLNVVEEHNKNVETDEDRIDEIDKCMNDFFYFCDNYLYTFDPRPLSMDKQVNRFILYDYQRVMAQELIDGIENGEEIGIDKSRDMGATWVILAVITWYFLFRELFHAHLGSRAEALVDDFTVDSLFGKIDFMLNRLPEWMQSQIPFNRKIHRKHLHLETYEGSIISGESTNKNFGRGPRKRVIFVDEFASVDCDRELWVAVSETAPCKIVASTPIGDVNQFADLILQKLVKVITMHWTMHPFRTLEWYKKKTAKMLPEAIASELDINYKASGGKLAFPQIKTHKEFIVIKAIILDPKDFTFDMGLDYGTTNPSSVHVYAKAKYMRKSESFPHIYSVWEYYEPSTIKNVSEAILGCPHYREGLIENIYADPSMWYNNQTEDDGKGVTNLALQFYQYYGIMLASGRRGDSFAVNQLKLMWADPKNPFFQIFDTCPQQIDEWEGLHTVKQTTAMSYKHNTPERLADVKNHSWDDFKYYFNQTFSGTIVEETVQKRGYEELQERFDALKSMKLSRLTKKPSRRRIFAGMFRS